MDQFPDEIVPTARIVLAGPVQRAAVARRTGMVCASDDRGEIGVWDPTGVRLAATRLAAPPRDLAVNVDASRIAVLTDAGDLLLLDGDLEVRRRFERVGGDRVLLDPAASWMAAVARAEGRAAVVDLVSSLLTRIDLPADLADAAPVRGALLVAGRGGTLARLTLAGELSFARDLACPLRRLAVHAGGRFVVVSALSRGAYGFDGRDGAPLGRFDVGLPVQAAAAGREVVALGARDGTLVLTDRAGRPRAWTRVASGVEQAWTDADGAQLTLQLRDGTLEQLRVVPRGADLGWTGARPARAEVVELGRPRAGVVPLVRMAPDRAVALSSDGPDLVRVTTEGRLEERVTPETPVLATGAAAGGVFSFVTERALWRWPAEGEAVVVRSHPQRVERAVLDLANDVVVTHDEGATLRWTSITDGVELRHQSLDPDDPVEQLHVCGGRVAVRTRAGRVLVCDGSHVEDLRTPLDRPGEPRLLAVDALGPIVVRGGRLHGLDWHGGTRWTRGVEGTVTSARAVAGGLLRVHARRFVEVLDARGSLVRRGPEPAGRCVAVVVGRPRGHRLLQVDGRRVSVLDERDRLLWHETLDEPVLAADAALDAACVVVRTGSGLLFLDGRGRAAPDRGGEPVADRTRIR